MEVQSDDESIDEFGTVGQDREDIKKPLIHKIVILRRSRNQGEDLL